MNDRTIAYIVRAVAIGAIIFIAVCAAAYCVDVRAMADEVILADEPRVIFTDEGSETSDNAPVTHEKGPTSLETGRGHIFIPFETKTAGNSLCGAENGNSETVKIIYSPLLGDDAAPAAIANYGEKIRKEVNES